METTGPFGALGNNTRLFNNDNIIGGYYGGVPTYLSEQVGIDQLNNHRVK